MARVLFVDYDGTLHDSDAKYASRLDGLLGLPGGVIWEAYLYVHRRVVHLEHPEKHDDTLFHQRMLFDRLKKPYDEAQAEVISDRFREAQEECWTRPLFFPDALPFLKEAGKRHTLYLTTGDYAAEKACAVERAGAAFKLAFDHHHLGIKGKSTYYKNALKATGADAAEVIVIGDSLEHDIAAGKGAGLSTIWVNRKQCAPPAAPNEPDYEVNNLLQALKHVC